MGNNNTYIGRKRTVLVEKISSGHKVQKDGMLRRFGLPLFFDMDFLRKNRFVVEMYVDDNIIQNDNVQGFSIDCVNPKEKTIKINTVLYINEWTDNYEKVNIIKIYLLDGMGNESRWFDFDVVYQGYSFSCDYKEDSCMIPSFVYKML